MVKPNSITDLQRKIAAGLKNNNILCTVAIPTITSSSTRGYTITQTDMEKNQKLFHVKDSVAFENDLFHSNLCINKIDEIENLYFMIFDYLCL